METNQLALLAKNGDLAAFEELYNSFAKRIFFHIRKKIQNYQDAEDVLQEVFIKSYKALPYLRPGEINFSGWLYTIANNAINDQLRKKYSRPDVISIDEGFDLPDNKSLQKTMQTESDLETARSCFKYLSARYRKVLELRFFKQLSVGEVAKVLNKNTLAVRVLQYRARKRLKQVSERMYQFN